MRSHGSQLDAFGFVLAAKNLVENRLPVMFMYHEPGDGAYSGWCFFSGTEDQAYCDNPDNIGVYDISTVIKIDSSVTPYLDSPVWSAFERMSPDSPFSRCDFGFVPEDENKH